MNEINRILEELEKSNEWFNQTDMMMIKDAMVKAALYAIMDSDVAREIIDYQIEKELTHVTTH